MTKVSAYKPKYLTYKVHLAGGQQRLREAILYVSDKSKDAPRFGLVKLNKIIWRADFTAFFERKVPVTGRAYQKLEHGPAPVEMRPLLHEMEQERLIEIDQTELAPDKVEQRVFAMVPAFPRFFSPSDFGYLDRAIEYYWNKTGMEASDDSHDIGWLTREIGDEMPYELAFLSDEELSGGALARATKKAEARRWASD